MSKNIQPDPKSIERCPPHNLQAELGVLGSITMLPSKFTAIEAFVSEEDFYDEGHGKIFAAMKWLVANGKPIDPTLLIDRLKAAGDYDAVGGRAYISKLWDAVPNAAHAEYYADIVAAKAFARRVITEHTMLLRAAYDDSLEASELMTLVDSTARRLTANLASSDLPESLAESAQRLIEHLKKPNSAGATQRAHFGIRAVDELVGAILSGETCIIAARPSMGKTSFGAGILRHAAMRGRPGLMVSMEMSSLEIVGREITRQTGIDNRNIREGNVTPEELARMAECQKGLVGFAFYTWAPTKATFADIRSYLINAKAKLGISVAVIDYIGLVSEPERRAGGNRRDHLAEVSRGFKRLAKELDIPLFILCQLNREASNERPTMAMIRECGAIEEDADCIMFLHQENLERDDERSLIVAKFRAGATGDVAISWEGRRFEFGDRDNTWNPE